MADMKKALAKWDAADEMLGQEIEKITAPWEELNITKTVSFSTYLSSDTAISGYYNSFLKRVVLFINGTTIKDVEANKALGIAYFTDTEYYPKALVYCHASDAITDLFFAKNPTNKYIALSNISSNVLPSGTVISAQLEYTTFD